jgi:ABC-2 type transport system ATP-binding protein
MDMMIEVQDLTKYYGPQLAVSRLDFQVAAGEIVGFLGPNGAGKTTTLKILAGFLAPSAGTARINGYDCVTDSLAVRRSLGYVPENVAIYPDPSSCGSPSGPRAWRPKPKPPKLTG